MSKITKEVSEVAKVAPSAALSTIFGEKIDSDDSLRKGLANLNKLPPFDVPPPVVHGRDFCPGLMGFRRSSSGNLNLTIVCDSAQVRSLTMAKYIAMVEHLHDPKTASIMLQNFMDSDERKAAKGQVLARINARSSAIIIIQGLPGRIIRGPEDIALYDVYYLDRAEMTSFYLAAKAQISTGDQIETMIAAYDGWKPFSVPLNFFNPHEQ